MYSETVREQVLRCAVTVFKTLQSKNIIVPESAELYLLPLEYDDVCLYYFVDMPLVLSSGSMTLRSPILAWWR